MLVICNLPSNINADQQFFGANSAAAGVLAYMEEAAGGGGTGGSDTGSVAYPAGNGGVGIIIATSW